MKNMTVRPGTEDGASAGGDSDAVETPKERGFRLRRELLEDIRATRRGYRVSDKISRDELCERRPVL